MAKKLSPAQVEVLRLVRDDKVYRSERTGTLYKSFRSDIHANVSRQVDVLFDATPRLIEIGERVGGERPWHITEAGTDELAKLDKEA